MPEAWEMNLKPLFVVFAGAIIVIAFVIWCMCQKPATDDEERHRRGGGG